MDQNPSSVRAALHTLGVTRVVFRPAGQFDGAADLSGLLGQSEARRGRRGPSDCPNDPGTS